VSGRLDGKVAVVTGAGRGVGRAYALLLAREGASVVVNDLAVAGGGPSSAEAVVQEIEQAGGRAVVSVGSVADFAQTEGIMRDAVDRFGRLDILIANAGNTRPRFIRESGERDWTDVHAVHTNGTFNSIHHAAPHLIAAGGGSIIATGDISKDLYFPGLASYRSAKAAIAVIAIYAAEELREFNINVNCVMPPATDTVMFHAYFDSLEDATRESFVEDIKERYEREGTAEAPLAHPDVVPPLGVFLCSDEGRAITGRLFLLHGRDIRIDAARPRVEFIRSDDEGGWTMDSLARRVPSWLASLDEQHDAAAV
jgi:NAD(P)-dependent dehydrogenase (short-subunit alcohol dehydrogenase family)